MLTKRTIHLGGYNTASHGWTLAGLELTEPEQVTNYVDVPGRIKGPLDMSTALTGWPAYTSRDLLVTLEISQGDRQERELIIAELTNRLHGQRVEIIHPDRPHHYAVGRLSVRRLYNNPAHGSVEITGTCEPWLYAAEETQVPLTAASTEKTVTLLNQGAMPVVPLIQVGGSVRLTYNGASLALSAGTYEWPELYLTPGEHKIAYTGTGAFTITYREAVLR